MKHRTNIFSTVLSAYVVLAAVAVAANDKDAEPGQPEPARAVHHSRGRPPQSEHSRRGIDMYMHRLRQKDPDEFARLGKLRRSDPPAFHLELRERLARLRKERFGRNNYRKWRGNARKQGEGHIESGNERDGRTRAWRKDDGEKQWLQQLRSELADLAREYHESDADERDRVAHQIKSVLGEIFDYRQKNRILTIERLEQKVEEMRRMIAEQSENRAAIIERQFRKVVD